MITNNQTITLVNRRREGRENLYFSTVFHGVNVVKLDRKVKTDKGYTAGSTFSIRIPFNSIINCGKEFIDADEFKQRDDVVDVFTVTSGDYIIFGESTQELDEEAITTNDKIHKIIDCADNTSALTSACKHIRIFCDEY
jgi:hypothetical protein